MKLIGKCSWFNCQKTLNTQFADGVQPGTRTWQILGLHDFHRTQIFGEIQKFSERGDWFHLFQANRLTNLQGYWPRSSR
jgi:hypothetical protein